MHGTVMAWLKHQRARHPDHFAPGARVLEFGSRNINGSPRELFPLPSFYCGIDCHSGGGVNIVGVVHEVAGEVCPQPVDVVVSTEMLEHDPYWIETLKTAVRHLRPGGLLLFSCASRKRPRHNLEDSPTPGYYCGVQPDEMIIVLGDACQWTELSGQLARQDLDSFVVGVKA